MKKIIEFFFTEDVNQVSVIMTLLAAASVVVATGHKLFTKIRPRLPVRVNCWFCNQNTDVNFSIRNSWDCPFCEQYNGFSQDGGYNKIIPAQSDELLNHPVPAGKRIPFKRADNGLCRKCNINQELKTQQLASFNPIDNARFEEEVELYKQRLERAYQLCTTCEAKADATLAAMQDRVNKLYSQPVAQAASKTCWQEQLKLLTIQFPSGLSAATSVAIVAVIVAAEMPALPKRLGLDLTSAAPKFLDVLIHMHSLSLMVAVVTRQCWISCKMLAALFSILASLVSLQAVLSALDFMIFPKIQCVLIVVSVSISILSFCSQYLKFRWTTKNFLPLKKATETSCELTDLNAKTSFYTNDEDDMNCSGTSSPCTSPNSLYLDPQEIQSELGGLSLGPLSRPKIAATPVFEPRIYHTPRSSPCSESVFGSSDGYYSPVSSDDLANSWGPRQRKSVLRPARLQLNRPTHSSWVGGGYWQNNDPSHLFPMCNSLMNYPISRSSSQSSGFISHGGTNFSSLPNSRCGSVCDGDRFSVMSEPAYPSFCPPLAPLASYCCFVANPHPGTTIVYPHPAVMSPPLTTPVDSRPAGQETAIQSTAITTQKLHQKSVVSIVKENSLLALFFFTSLVFNAVVITYSVLHYI